MKIAIEIPDNLQQFLERALGADLALAAREELAVAWYRAGNLSIGQVAELLGLSIYETDGLLKLHGVDLTYSIEELDEDRHVLDRLLRT